LLPIPPPIVVAIISPVVPVTIGVTSPICYPIVLPVKGVVKLFIAIPDPKNFNNCKGSADTAPITIIPGFEATPSNPPEGL